ncbi:amidohydrolase family protein [Phyllobacterium zundukense]|uniref:Amidohydrolase family protein n=1 Tax=Phyllobacterium zundukense TaxID=1867719 RepID=A0ACD4CVB0_9HYPH|nr:amidohydrolase family protein [Phyllobacterium zundukense]UXN57525.1 amidohydrolase family protein [Phyllobacterium zundukense]
MTATSSGSQGYILAQGTGISDGRLNIPIIDTHVHLCDPARFTYRWADEHPGHLRKCYVADVFETVKSPQLERFIFVEAAADWQHVRGELTFASEQAAIDPRLAGFVAAINMEADPDNEASIAALAAFPLVRGIRLLSRFARDPRFFLRNDISRLLGGLSDLGLTCEIGVWSTGINDVTEIVARCPRTLFIITHAGKPSIISGAFDRWADDLARLAQLPNVVCKLSGLATLGADGRALTDDVSRHFAHAYEVFGAKRTLFGSDWPTITSEVHYQRWIEVIRMSLKGASSSDELAVFRDNAVAVYRLSDQALTTEIVM